MSPTDAVFLDVTNAFVTLWVDDLLYQGKILKFLSYILKSIPSNLHDRIFETSFQTATNTLLLGRWRDAGWTSFLSRVHTVISMTILHLLVTSNWPSTPTTWPSYRHPLSQRCCHLLGCKS